MCVSLPVCATCVCYCCCHTHECFWHAFSCVTFCVCINCVYYIYVLVICTITQNNNNTLCICLINTETISFVFKRIFYSCCAYVHYWCCSFVQNYYICKQEVVLSIFVCLQLKRINNNWIELFVDSTTSTTIKKITK